MSDPNVKRNEPCPCGSGKKYKRCCGFTEKAPEATPAGPSLADLSKMDPQKMAAGMDQEWLGQVGQAFRQLPRGQQAQFQALMQQAMSGRDVSAQMARLEKSLPAGFKTLMEKAPQGMGALGAGDVATAGEAATEAAMSVDEAKRLVEEAVAAGKVSAEEAEKLLNTSSEKSSWKFWKK